MNISGPMIDSKTTSTSSKLSAKMAQRLLSFRPILIPDANNADEQSVTVVCISDTHNARPTLPDGDILLHAGDLSQYGTFAEIQAQLDWLNTQPHQHKVVIAGNHDLIIDSAFVKSHPDRELYTKGSSAKDLEWGDMVYLQDSSVALNVKNRSVSIFGSPSTPRCGNFAFQYDQAKDIWSSKVPQGTDILLTHGPPATLLDNGKGCEHLLAEIWRSKPQLVVFGHIHEAHGHVEVRLDRIQALGQKILLGHKGWFAVLQLLLVITWEWLQSRFRKADKPATIQVVNAALDQRRAALSEFKAYQNQSGAVINAHQLRSSLLQNRSASYQLQCKRNNRHCCHCRYRRTQLDNRSDITGLLSCCRAL